ncbi:uncharacterized protein ACIB01_012804 isoform 1-T3 [Guaruba guarouba]
MAQERVSNIQVIANTLKAVLTDPCLKLTKVDDLMQIICRQLVLVTRRSLWDTLMQTLLQMAQLHCQDVTTSLLHISIPGDIDVALQLQGNPRTSENCPDKSCYGQGGPADSELWHHTTTEAMWNMLVCEPSILSRILKSLLLIQHTSMSHNIFGTKRSCRLLLTVSVRMRPGLPCLGLRTPLQLLLPSSSAPKPGPPKGHWGLQGYSQTCCWALRQIGRQPAPAALGVLLPPHLLPFRQPGSLGAEQAVGLVKVSAV